jgi:glycerophosphoryl diester phosphodiesterase
MRIGPFLLGHRGARGEEAILENTPAAFDLALASGCDGFEFDVRLTADEEAVLCHDPRHGGLEIAHSPSPRLGLPQLREVLTVYRHTAFLNMELKVPGLEISTARLLRELPPPRGCVVSSFFPQVLATLRGLDAAIPLGLICETETQLRQWPRFPVEYVIVQHKLLRRDEIQELKNAGKKIFVWTVNTARDMKRFAAWEVDGIISDNPKRLALTLR